MPDKPTIYRITHLWPNKQPGHGSTTAQIEEQGLVEAAMGFTQRVNHAVNKLYEDERNQEPIAVGKYLAEAVLDFRAILGTVSERSSTVQIKPETDEPNALPSRFVSLQDYEALERERR